MQPRTCMLSAFTLSTAMFFGTAVAADLPKEGTWTATYSAFGMAKATPVGKERLLLTYDDNGLTVGDGLLNHMTWHCWGLGDYTSGTGQDHGNCVGTDPAGDQIAIDWNIGKHPMDQKLVNGSFTLTTGTGKYAGITGSATFADDGNEFKPATDGTYFAHNTNKGSYKLP